MSAMIERVARAILAESYRIGNTHGDFDALSPEVQGVFTRFARAAIEEMRVPVADMVGVGTEARWRSAVRDANSINAIWNAMIDAALKETA